MNKIDGKVFMDILFQDASRGRKNFSASALINGHYCEVGECSKNLGSRHFVIQVNDYFHKNLSVIRFSSFYKVKTQNEEFKYWWAWETLFPFSGTPFPCPHVLAWLQLQKNNCNCSHRSTWYPLTTVPWKKAGIIFHYFTQGEVQRGQKDRKEVLWKPRTRI